MRVAFLTFDFPEYCARLANELAQKLDLLVLMPQQFAAVPGAVLDSAVRLHSFHKPRLRQPVQQIRMLREVSRRMRLFRPHVFHLQQGHLWFNFALSGFHDVPLVLTVHDPMYHVGDRASRRTPHWVMRHGYRHAAEVIVHGEKLKELMAGRFGMDRQRIHVIPHIALKDSSPPAGPSAPTAKTVLFFGRIWPYKGLEYLIRAEPLISRCIPDVQIVIAGEGEEFSRYRRQMVHPEKFTVYNHFIADDAANRLFAASSLIVLPYIEASQSGVVPLAFSAGKPVIATNVGSLPESVEHGKTGLIVPPRDEHALADAIVSLLQNPARRNELGQNARCKLETEFAPPVVARQTIDVYRRAVRVSCGY